MTGRIINEKGSVVSSLQSNSLGMGSFFILADSTSTYYSSFSSPEEEGLSLTYPLPKVVPTGNVLSVTRYKDQINLAVSRNYKTSDSAFVQVNSRGMAYFSVKGRLRDGQFLARVPANELPEGIIEFSLLDSNKQPVAQRLYFNERPEERLHLSVSTDKAAYVQREQTSLSVAARNADGETVNANLSVLVIDKAKMGAIQQSRKNILSHFLLGSELRGEIEDPAYYFREENRNRLHDLDALLLTQGWSKYNYQKPLQDSLVFQPEPVLNLSGTIEGGLFGNRKKEGVKLTMMTFGENPTILEQTTDSLGQFYFDLHHLYGKDPEIVIQSTNKRGKETNFDILLDEKESPEISYDPGRSIEKPDSVIVRLAREHQKRNLREESFEFASGVTELDEVELEGYQMTPERRKVMEIYGKPDLVIPGKAIQEKEQKWSYGLYSVLIFSFPDDIRIAKDSIQGEMRAQVIGGDMTLVVVDGIPVKWHSYDLIPYIPPSEVRSVEVIRYANNFSRLYMDTYMAEAAVPPPAWGSVIAIYTHSGNGILAAEKPTGILRTTIPAFSLTREFYAPKYENLASEDWAKPDLRSLIHWEPQLEVDSTGSASTSFYNADSIGEMLVVVEAISENGEIGYQEIIYEVKERK